MSTQQCNRNPWLDVASYTTSDAARFKGRSDDLSKYLKIMSSGTMSVLYADSGIGKTSFIQAGLIPALMFEGYLPIHILFPDDVYIQEIDIEQWIVDRIHEKYQWKYKLTEPIEECNQSLWWLLHTHELVNGDDHAQAYKPFIVFDQFEEVFVKSRKQPNSNLLEQLFNLIENLSSRSVPPAVEEVLETKAAQGIFVDIDVDHAYKVVFSLRKEFLSDFDYWTNDRFSVPELHQNRMLLLPLTRIQAEQVITMQPTEDGEGFVDILNSRKDDIINKIDEKGQNEVDPFILSLLCSRLYEDAVCSGHTETLDDIHPEKVIWEFYEEKMLSIVSDKKHVKAIEDSLVDEDGNRLRPEIRYDKLKEISFSNRYAKALEDAHLIRTDKYNDNEYVELTHDMLARAIKQHRDEQERQDELTNATKRLKRRQRLLIVVIAALLLGGGSLLWYLHEESLEKEKLDFYHTIKIAIQEDSAFSDKPQWEADVLIKRFNSDSLLYKCHLVRDKVKVFSFQLHDSIYSHDSLRVIVEPTDSLRLCKSKTDTLHVIDSLMYLRIDYNSDAKYGIKGRVICRHSGGAAVPVNLAYVTLNNEVVRTNDDGFFQFSFNDINKTRYGCLTVFKRDYKFVQTELEYLKRQSGDIVEIELPLKDNTPMDTLYERRRVAIDGLFNSAKRENRITSTTEIERKWMRDIVVLDTIKADLRKHASKTACNLFSQMFFLSCVKGKDVDLRPIFGWYYRPNARKSAPLLFSGVMFRTTKGDAQDKKTERWRIRITSFNKIDFRTEEHSLIIENPRSDYFTVDEIEY